MPNFSDLVKELFDKSARSGPNNSQWKGEDAGYRALHYRVEQSRGTPQLCEACGTTDKDKQYDWASTSGSPTDPGSYRRLCRSCHMNYDNQR